MVGEKNVRVRVRFVGLLAILAVLVAGCGGATRVDPTASASSASAAADAPVLTTTSGPLGTYLVDGSGRAVYLYDADPEGGSECYQACTSAWPPVPGNATAGSGLDAKDLTSSARTDGINQAVYNEHSLYYYSKDTAAGETSGQGFVLTGGGIFYLLGPDGTPIETAAAGSSGAASSAPATSSSGG
jgi:predicted lipoprotein with Yx(FWY)xxD motif